ncbi:sideroflexin-4 [Brachionichthys hirsutus]|uniref:sideroflexin-4 n=1 Tax=Brachionichthys hirsutus TaxID=412623 RepID=UPI003604B8D3
MDANLSHWKLHGQSFLSRLRIWIDLIDPLLLSPSDDEIQEAHARLGSGEKLNEKDGRVPALSLSSVHADTGATLPLVFRPPAFLLLSAPLVICSSSPHSNVRAALFWQLLFQSYVAGFNLANRNSSSEQGGKKLSSKQLLLTAGTVSYVTCAGALPQIFMNRLRITSPPIQTFFKSVLPIPLSAALAFFSVYAVRSEESETGIRVFDADGNPVGFSKAAGGKAVRETAFSRAVLFGATAAVPNLLALLLRRRLLQRSPITGSLLMNTNRFFVLGLMIPFSFSLCPQLGAIKKEKVEEELRTEAGDGQLYYHRGL